MDSRRVDNRNGAVRIFLVLAATTLISVHGVPVAGTWRVDNAAEGEPLRSMLDTTWATSATATELEVVKNIPGLWGAMKAAAVGEQPYPRSP